MASEERTNYSFLSVATSLTLMVGCGLLTGFSLNNNTKYHKPAIVADTAQRLNVLWLVTEDISPYIAAYGDSTAKTPNLDRLAHEGVRYTNVFDVSGVCAPSRSALITGMYPTCLGTDNMRTQDYFPQLGIPKYSVVLPPFVKMFSQIMREHGYYTTNNNKDDYQFRGLKAGWDQDDNQATWKNRPDNKPFFSVFNFFVTHESQIWVRKNDSMLVDPLKVKLPPYYPEDPIIGRDVARMYSNIVLMDRLVGQKLKELEDAGLLDKTIIVWYSDNGGPLPRGKREIYDSGLRVPMLIRFPNAKSAGTTDSQLISFVDMAPTVLSWAKIKIPDYMQGQAFSGGQKAKPRKYIYAARDRMDECYDMVRAVGDGRFKYIKNYRPELPYIQNISYRRQMDLMNQLIKLNEDGKLDSIQNLWFRKTKPAEEFYNTKADPYELHDLANDPRYSTKKRELKAVLENWMKNMNDKGFIPEKKFVESMWPRMIQPSTAQPDFTMQRGKIHITCSTIGNAISWQLVENGKNPDKNGWQIYTHPVTLLAHKDLYAMAERIGYKPSNIVKFNTK